MPRPITEFGRTRYSYKSQIEFLEGRMRTEKLTNDADTAELMVMYQSLIDSVNQAVQARRSADDRLVQDIPAESRDARS